MMLKVKYVIASSFPELEGKVNEFFKESKIDKIVKYYTGTVSQTIVRYACIVYEE